MPESMPVVRTLACDYGCGCGCGCWCRRGGGPAVCTVCAVTVCTVPAFWLQPWEMRGRDRLHRLDLPHSIRKGRKEVDAAKDEQRGR